jgi:hypothetical protein
LHLSELRPGQRAGASERCAPEATPKSLIGLACDSTLPFTARTLVPGQARVGLDFAAKDATGVSP